MDFKITEKRWTKEKEQEIIKEWEKRNDFKFDVNTNKKVYSIDTPPPYVNSPIHIGHATTYVMQDMFARYHRMKDYEVLFPMGFDRNGLPIEVAAEKKFKVRLTTLSREEALKYCEKILETSSESSKTDFRQLGISFNSYEIGTNVGDGYYTDMKDYRILTQNTFIDLWHRGLIYEDERINNWDPKLRTTLADSEVEYKEIETDFVFVRFKVKKTGKDIIIATTRPELIASCGMIIFNPEDDRYKNLDGKTIITPIYEKEVKIKAHPQAKIDKGTGLVMMCSAGDLSDIRFFREQSLKPIISIGIDGRMNEKAGFLKGLKVKEARAKIIDELEKRDLIVEKKKVMHRIPVAERSKAEIEFIEMKEYYLKQMEFKDKLWEISKKIKFYDENSRKILRDWVKAVAIDWPISRRRFYGTEIPAWHCKKCGYTYVPKEKGKYYQPWKETPPINKCPKCGENNWEGETRIFDTWFDSANSPLYIMGFKNNLDFFNKNIPCSLRPQGKEIVRTWLYYTLLKAYLLLDKPIFEDVWIHYHVVDEKGYKMSKSKGNGIAPKDVLDKYGSEAFRMWVAIEGNITKTDLKCSFDRIKGSSKTITKLWNVARFISTFKQTSDKYKLREIDKWIINKINKIIEKTDELYKIYDFHNPSIDIKHFLWEDFASHYLEMAKKRIYDETNFTEDEKNGAIYTLNYVLQKILLIWAPVIPMITYEIYKTLYDNNINKELFPEIEILKTDLKQETLDLVLDVNSEIWKYKKDNDISLRDPIDFFEISKSLEPIVLDLKVLHDIKEVKLV